MPPSAPPIPVGTRLLHIGPERADSSALQTSFRLAREDLRRHGVHYATGSRVRPALAGWAFGLPGRPAGTPRPEMWVWNQLVKQVAESPSDRVVVSNHDFSRATPEQIPRILGDLGGAERCRVVLVATTRLDLVAAARWQDRVKGGDHRSYDAWLRVVLAGDDAERSPEGAGFWRSLDLADLVARWSTHVGPGAVTVVVPEAADPRGARTAFEELLALPGGVLPQPAAPEHPRRGLTWGECETLRVINEEFVVRGWSKPVRRRFVRGQILPELRDRTPPPGPLVPPLSDWAADALRSSGAAWIDGVASSGVEVIGDLGRLRVPDDLETVSGPYPEPEIPRRVVGEVVGSLIGATLAAEEAEAAAIDAEVDDEDAEDDGELME